VAQPRRLALKRVYAAADPGDGRRVLVERLWPRGLSKDKAAVDLWLKEIAPSDELRRWFHAEPEARWPEFQKRYREELRGASEPLAELHKLMRSGPVTLLFGARDEAHNSAVVLKGVLEAKAG
jgi:uncharacterized protein YeaO (DUF488 family)